MANSNISHIIDIDLCTGCGTCTALCPNNALKMVKDERKGIYLPEIDLYRCNNCGLCNKVCPGQEVNFEKLNESIFGKRPDDYYIGNYINCYVGYSLDQETRYKCTSGGLITELLTFALENGIIDGALVTRMSKEKPLEPEPFIARTRDEIIEAKGSKYCPVPANIALKNILESKEGEKFAVVGLPCHIHGIRKAEQINSELKKRIILHFGIICSRTPNLLATKYILKRFNIKEEEISRISYRGEGWPGEMRLNNEGKVIHIPFFKYWTKIFDLCFIPNRCFICCDGVCEVADVSFGDAWLPEYKKDKIGRSILAVRTPLADSILKEALDNKKIELVSVEKEKLNQSQEAMLNYKKRDISTRIAMFKLLRKRVPLYEGNCIDYKFNISYKSILMVTFSSISNNTIVWRPLALFDSFADMLRDSLIYMNKKRKRL